MYGDTYQTYSFEDYGRLVFDTEKEANKLIVKDSTSQKSTCSEEIVNIENEIIKKYGITAVNLCEIEYEFADYLYDNSIGVSTIISRTKYDNLFIIPSKKLSAGGKLDKWARGEATEIENRNAIKRLSS